MMTNVSRAWFAGLSLLVACAGAEEVTATDGSAGGGGGSRYDAATADRAGSDTVDASSSDALGSAGSNVSGVDAAPSNEEGGPGVDDAAIGANADSDAESGANVGPLVDASVPGDERERVDADGTATIDASAQGDGAGALIDVGGAVEAGSSDGATSARGLVVTYHSTSATQVQFDVHVTNTGTQSPPLRTLTVRYYLTAENTPGAADIFLDSAGFQSSIGPTYYAELLKSCTATYTAQGLGGASSDASPDDAALPDATPGGDAYLDINCAVDQPLIAGSALNVQVRVTGSSPTNDYSYQPGDVAPNGHIVVLESGAAVAGTPPP